MSRGRELLARPISEDERPRLFALIAAVLLVVAGLLTVIAPADEHAPPTAARSTVTAPDVMPEPSPVAPGGPPVAVTVASRAFVSDYLAFVHGRTEERPTFGYASTRLARRLAGYRLRVSPGARTRRPHVLRLAARRLTGRPPRWVMTATIADGGVATYPIEFVIAVRDGRPVVIQLGEE